MFTLTMTHIILLLSINFGFKSVLVASVWLVLPECSYPALHWEFSSFPMHKVSTEASDPPVKATEAQKRLDYLQNCLLSSN